jgi:enoyl-CoA hydratase/carnithine racemase
MSAPARRQLIMGLFQDYVAAQDLAHREQLSSLKSADFREGIAALREKRAAVFSGL